MGKLTEAQYDAMSPAEKEAARQNTPIGGVTIAQLSQLLHNMIAGAVEPLKAELSALRTEVAGKAYFGVWDAATQYSAGAVVTDKSNLWIAKRVSQGQRPGTSRDLWALALRRGRDVR